MLMKKEEKENVDEISQIILFGNISAMKIIPKNLVWGHFQNDLTKCSQIIPNRENVNF